MEYKVEKLFAVPNNKVVKANGVLMLDKLVAVNFTVMDGKNGPFVSWKGTEKYTKKDGTVGYASPVIFDNKEPRKFDDEVKAFIISKYRAMAGSPAPTASATPTDATQDFCSDDIPF